MQTVVMRCSENEISRRAGGIVKNAHGLCRVTHRRRFRALFGVTPAVASIVWNRLQGHIPRKASPIHLLWAFLFLKTYGSEHVNCALTKVDEKTFRKWSWIFVRKIADLRVVCTFCFPIFTSNHLRLNSQTG